MEKIIPEFPNYKINTSGQVFTRYCGKGLSVRLGEWRPLTQVVCSSTGYPLVTLCHEGVRKNKRIHRLLMEAFVPNPHNKKHINHIDGIKTNISLDNLEWATPKENAQHASKTGLTEHAIAAQRVAVVQYTPDGLHVIAEHPSIHEAGRSTGVAWQNISKVVRGLRPRAGGFVWEYKKV